ncbi:MAG: cysteine synthase A, partial [Spirochaetaceae bacterium]|nr:cysteine synthase A [Spirochaetaceae bacterium]
MPIAPSLLALVGETPLVYLNKVGAGLGARIAVKLETRNPLASVKDRIGLAIVEAAERDGLLKPGGTLVEATSGNTGIALAWVGAVKAYRVVLVMPDTMSIERRKLLAALGATLELSPGSEGMAGAVRRAEEIARTTPGAILARQFENAANPAAHRKGTAEEIWRDSEGKVDVFVAAVGTGGTLTGAGGRLKELKPGLRVVAVEPAESPLLSQGKAGPHKIQGIGANFVPPILDRTVADEIETVTAHEAGEISRRLAREEGILCGISA